MLTLFERLGRGRGDPPRRGRDRDRRRAAGRAGHARAHAARGRRGPDPPAPMSGFGLDHLPYGVVDGRCVVRYGDHVVELSGVPGLPPVFDGPTLNPFLALGRARLGADPRAADRGARGGHRRAAPARRAAAADRRRRLRRLLLVARARHERRPAVPARRPAAADLARAADRLPRPRRLGRRVRHADRAPARGCGRPTGRPRSSTSSSSSASSPAPADPRIARRRRARARLRLRARQRLERARHPALRVPPARAVPGQVVRDLDRGLDHAAGRARAVPGARARAGSASRPTTCGPQATGRSTSRSRSSSTARSITRGNARGLYWTFPQQLAHATVNGAAVRPGDLFASGTISGFEPGSEGSLLESGAAFLADGDTVVLRGRAGSVTLGEVRGTIVP